MRRETPPAVKEKLNYFVKEIQPVMVNSKHKKRIKAFAKYFKEEQPQISDEDIRFLLWGDQEVCI